MINSFPLSQVKITDPLLVNAFQKEITYLESLESDRFLSYFRITKGLEAKAKNYGGWENMEIRGHSLGHFLIAMSQSYGTTKDTYMYERILYIIEELSLCQFESGYLSAFPEEFFDRVENEIPVWVPWYTMHKLISGLNVAYVYTKIPLALKIVSTLGTWVFNRTSRWTSEIHAKVLAVEYGGMNDCMYELYQLTGDKNHLIAAHQFDEIELFKRIHAGQDVLNNRHANTTIPKFLGAVNRFIACGNKESFYLESGEAFWKMVVENHSYITGGNSEWEHFGESQILDAERSETNCETCNTYNMLKLSRRLFQISGNHQYFDFYERTFINAILSSQNPNTGMTTYFQPMATGYFKVYGNPYDHFWCCTGTGMENFTKLNDSLYFHADDQLFINMYFSSVLEWVEQGITLTQVTDIPMSDTVFFTITAESPRSLTLSYRVPQWVKSIKLRINGERVNADVKDGFIHLKRLWKDQDQVILQFEMKVGISSLPDNPNSVAFTYGPLVLSAGLGSELFEESTCGIIVKIPTKRIPIKDYLVLNQENVNSWKRSIAENLIKRDGTLEFRLTGTDEDDQLVFTPHYKQHTERYGIYWTLFEKGSDALMAHIEVQNLKLQMELAEIDTIPIGNDQYELSHCISGHKTESGDRDGFHYREASDGGWFSYKMNIQSSENNYLQFSYMPGEWKDRFEVYINDQLILSEAREEKSWRDIIEKNIFIPKEIHKDCPDIIVRFQAMKDDFTARIIDRLRISKA